MDRYWAATDSELTEPRAYAAIDRTHRPYVWSLERRASTLGWRALIERVAPVTSEQWLRRHPPGELEEITACVLCGEDRFQPLLRALGWDQTLVAGKKGTYPVVRCVACGFLFRNPNVKPERLGDLYKSGYTKFLGGVYAKRRKRRYRLTLAAFSPLFDEGGGRRLLDFGCGSGLFLDLAHERGFETYGVDLAPDAVEHARARPGGERTYLGSPLEIPEIAVGGFDVITMWSVLAHLPRPLVELEMLRSLLAPSGVLLILTVNAESMMLKRYLGEWNGLDKRHLVFFSPATLERAAQLTGFSGVEFRPFYSDTVEAMTTKLTPEQVARLRATVDETGGGNMIRALLRA